MIMATAKMLRSESFSGVYGMILMMNKLMRWSGAVWAAAEAAVARLPQLFLPPPPFFA